MVALKSAEVESFLARPDASRPVILIYGADAGLVRERAEKLIAASVDDPKDPFALMPLEGDLLASEPARLAEEAHTVPLFGGRRAVWIKAGARNFTAAVELVLATPPKDCRIVIEAGELRRNSPLRVMCEKAKGAAVIACYADAARDLARLVDEEMRAAGLAIAPEARAMLVSLIGGDRLASRSEIRKLALYAHGRTEVALDDVLAVVADASELALDNLLDAVFAGKPGETETQFAKARAAGTGAQTILMAAQRHVAQLHKARLVLEAGESIDAALRVFVPPVHFRRKEAVESALNAWTSTQLAQAMQQLFDTLLDIRRLRAPVDDVAVPLAQRALLSLAQARRRSR